MIWFFFILLVLEWGKCMEIFCFKPKQYDFNCLDYPSKLPSPPSRPPKSPSVSSGSPPRPPKPATYNPSLIENETILKGNVPIVPPRRRNSPSAFVEQSQDVNGNVHVPGRPSHQMSQSPVVTSSTDSESDKNSALKKSPVLQRRSLSPSNSSDSTTAQTPDVDLVRKLLCLAFEMINLACIRLLLLSMIFRQRDNHLVLMLCSLFHATTTDFFMTLIVKLLVIFLSCSHQPCRA